jgi:Na+-transporting NADH:ubiquinone oxidoreductase subunit NqrC
MSDLLAGGEIDALLGARHPASFKKSADVVACFRTTVPSRLTTSASERFLAKDEWERFEQFRDMSDDQPEVVLAASGGCKQINERRSKTTVRRSLEHPTIELNQT